MEWTKLSSHPFTVPNQAPVPGINEENFNWKLWQTLKSVYDVQGQQNISVYQPVIALYNKIYELLPVDVEKRINFNTLGIVLGYKYKQYKKNYKNFIKKNSYFLDNGELNNGLDNVSLIQYIEYFKKSK